LGMQKSLWAFGIFQGAATILFAALVYSGPNTWVLALVITADNIAIGMGTTAFASFIMSRCNRKFTATQYALLTSLMAVPASVVGAGSGFLAEYLGWVGFFVFCTLAAVPGLLLLLRYSTWENANP
jgi:PAT family beta-lactamase induction signal transducer AmpG